MNLREQIFHLLQQAISRRERGVELDACGMSEYADLNRTEAQDSETEAARLIRVLRERLEDEKRGG